VQLRGEFPDDIKTTVQYGENLQALTVALNTVGAVSVNRTHEILSGVFGIPLSTGTVSNMVGRCSINLIGILDRIRQTITTAEIIHNDETGTRVDGKTLWVHNASISKYTHLTISEKRGQEGMDDAGVLPDFLGISVHDCWAPYWKYPNIFHALCCAHLLRELIGVEENHPDQKWATAFIELLLEMKKAKELAIDLGEKQLHPDIIQKFERLYDQVIKQGLEENPLPEKTKKKRGRIKKGKVLALIERLEKYKESVCLFINNFDVPFDNNQAERDVRMIKTKTKVSGCFRSLLGAQNYLRIMSYVGTVKKHGISAYEAIRQAVIGNPDFFFNKES
jgi:transposase